MYKILKTEINKAFHNKGMFLSLCLGIGCVSYQLFTIINRIIEMEKAAKLYDLYNGFATGGFYPYWLVSYLDPATIYYFYFLGIMVALPFGASYFLDKNNGIIKNICTRTEKKKYLNAKYISVFLSGGFVAVIPLIIDLLIIKLIRPIDCYEEFAGSVLNSLTEWNVFIIDNPYLAAGIILVTWFVFAGSLATISLMTSAFSNNIFTIQLTPFLVMMVLYYMPTFLKPENNRYFPFYFLTLFGKGTPIIGIIESALIMMITYLVFYRVEMKKDIL